MASSNRVFESGDYMTDVHKVTVQVRAPKGTFPGEVAEGWYVVFENNVILTDADGKPIEEFRAARDAIKQHVLKLLDSQKMLTKPSVSI